MSTFADDETEGVVFVHEDDGRVTARDTETGIASYGDTKSEALAMLAEALALDDRDDDEPLSDAALRELGLDPEDTGEEELPEFMR
jgi:predicted RNase H-like HicB family nuclease